MSDIDEIALNVVKAIAEIDPDKLPGGRTQAVAQAQILVRDAISGEIEALKAANRDLQNWFDDARATAEQAQARVAELEAEAEWLIATGSKLTRAKILRKQAQAVDAFADTQIRCKPPARAYAQRLRQQAGKAGKAGGGQCL